MISFKLVLFNAVLVLLGPIFILQGKRVRATTPKLPEPTGPRQGTQTSNAPSLSVWILGDSAAAGVGVEHQQQALSGHLIAQLANSFSISWRLDARTGRTSKELLEIIEGAPPTQDETPVILVSIGVNDITSRVSIKHWKRNIVALITSLQNTHNAQHVIFSALPPMGKFPALPQPLRWILGLRASLLTDALHRISSKHAHVSILEYTVPQTSNQNASDFMASDGFHPGYKAYREWGVAAAKHIAMLSLSN